MQGNGIGESDFIQPRPRAYLRDMFARVGYAMSSAEFEAIFAEAARRGVTPPGSVSVQEFRDALNELMAARDAGEGEPAWFAEAMR